LAKDQQRKVQTQQVSQRGGGIKARPLGSTNYYTLDSEMKNSMNNNNILVLPPVTLSSNRNVEANKENKHLSIPKNPEMNPIDSNSQSNIQSNIQSESPNLKKEKAVSKYSEVPENLDLNKDMSALTKVKIFFMIEIYY